MNKVILIIAAAALGLIFATSFDGCSRRKIVTSIDSTSYLNRQIEALRAKLKDRKVYHDTIREIRTAYRNRLLQVDRWIYDSTRNILCDSFAGGSKDSTCFRILARRLATAEFADAVIPIYQRQREEDSLQIGYLMQLDSLHSELNTAHLKKQKVLEGEIVQAKKESRKKAVKMGLGGLLGGFIVGVVL